MAARMPLLAALAWTLLAPLPSSGQILFDWPMRAGPEPEAILTGAGGALWNPAGPALAPSELWIVSAEGPEATDLRGLALAASRELFGFGTLALGYRHQSIDDIPRTGPDSPNRLPGDVDVSEHGGGLALARRVGARVAVGGSVRHLRASVEGLAESRTEWDLGVAIRDTTLMLRPRAGFALRGLGGHERVLAGVEASAPPSWTGAFRTSLAWGFDADGRSDRVDQRVSLRVTWRELIHLAGGFTVQEGEDDLSGLWMVGLDAGRYSAAFLREEMAGGFGSATSFRLAVRLP